MLMVWVAVHRRDIRLREGGVGPHELFGRTLAGGVEWAPELFDEEPLNAETVATTVTNLLNATTKQRDEGWWRTPLGMRCARALAAAAPSEDSPKAATDTSEVTHAVAAEMLGVACSTIGGLVESGTLRRGPNGSVLASSVLRRLAAQLDAIEQAGCPGYTAN